MHGGAGIPRGSRIKTTSFGGNVRLGRLASFGLEDLSKAPLHTAQQANDTRIVSNCHRVQAVVHAAQLSPLGRLRSPPRPDA